MALFLVRNPWAMPTAIKFHTFGVMSVVSPVTRWTNNNKPMILPVLFADLMLIS